MKYTVIEFLFICYLVLICAAGARGAVIEAEDYRQGGEGVAYHDSDSENRGNSGLRTDEGVDLWQGENADVQHVRIGSTSTGEWVTWQYDFPKAGAYKIQFYTATPNDSATMRVAVGDGQARDFVLPNTGSYGDFMPVEFEENVDAGVHIIRMDITGSSFDIDRIEIESIAKDYLKADYVTYVATTDKRLQVAWDPVDNAGYYVVRVFNLEKNVYVDLDEAAERIAGTAFEMQFPYAGHFIPEVKACRDVEGEDPECSIWAISTSDEYATVDGEPRAWWLYGYIQKPGPITIE